MRTEKTNRAKRCGTRSALIYRFSRNLYATPPLCPLVLYIPYVYLIRGYCGGILYLHLYLILYLYLPLYLYLYLYLFR